MAGRTWGGTPRANSQRMRRTGGTFKGAAAGLRAKRAWFWSQSVKVYGEQVMVHGARFMANRLRCMVCGARFMANRLWCMVQGLWRTGYGAWCKGKG
jgi:hypothetical protein